MLVRQFSSFYLLQNPVRIKMRNDFGSRRKPLLSGYQPFIVFIRYKTAWKLRKIELRTCVRFGPHSIYYCAKPWKTRKDFGCLLVLTNQRITPIAFMIQPFIFFIWHKTELKYGGSRGIWTPDQRIKSPSLYLTKP